MCKECVRICKDLLPKESETDCGEFLISATCFPHGSVRQTYYSARQSLRAGGWTINGAIRFANLELRRSMRKIRNRERLAAMTEAAIAKAQS